MSTVRLQFIIKRKPAEDYIAFIQRTTERGSSEKSLTRTLQEVRIVVDKFDVDLVEESYDDMLCGVLDRLADWCGPESSL